jgi:Gas vesicle synthesis protein GvpL/GvpF
MTALKEMSAMTTDRILGYAPLADLDGLLAMMNAVAGPAVEAVPGPTLAALVQPEPEDGLFCRQPISQAAGQLMAQRRLAVACLAGPFLPHDPETALVPTSALRDLLAPAWNSLDIALSTHGRHHQWDILLRWSPDDIIARQGPALPAARGKTGMAETIRTALRTERQTRQAQLLNTLAPAVLAFAAGGPTGSDTEVLVTTLVEASGEKRMEAALAALDGTDPWIDLRGPLPPVTFAPVRAICLSTAELNGAWQTLDLPRRVNRTGLHHHWRHLAASINPLRPVQSLSGAAPSLSGLTDAYRLLRGLLPVDGRGASLAEILGKAGWRLVVPDAPVRVAPPVRSGELALAS